MKRSSTIALSADASASLSAFWKAALARRSSEGTSATAEGTKKRKTALEIVATTRGNICDLPITPSTDRKIDDSLVRSSFSQKAFVTFSHSQAVCSENGVSIEPSLL